MATKQELAESLTIAELKQLAEEHDVDVSGCEVHADYADAVAAGVTKDVLEAAAAPDADAAAADGEDDLGPAKDKGPDVVPEPDPAPEIGSPEAPSKGSDAYETPSGYALAHADGDPDKYASLRAQKRYG